METARSLPRSQMPATWHYPEILRILSLLAHQAERQFEHYSRSTADGKDEWIYISTLMLSLLSQRHIFQNQVSRLRYF